ncbi:hypothetical protein GCM10023262_11710 [Bartonella pachyuromydis]|uniref:Uncharacterized protein n=1 Tax=Bartonella pachyuromydis TaxID=931097 RepID=A0ABP8VIR9_9HYPH
MLQWLEEKAWFSDKGLEVRTLSGAQVASLVVEMCFVSEELVVVWFVSSCTLVEVLKLVGEW